MISDKPGRKQLKIGNNAELQKALESYAEEIGRPPSTAARMLLAKSLSELTKSTEEIITLDSVLGDSDGASKNSDSKPKSGSGVSIIIHNYN